jgi:translation elongation factor EF-4
MDGSLKKGDKITSVYTKAEYEVMELGILYPDPISTGSL